MKGSYWFAVVAVPLTILTFAVWWWWLSHSIRTQERKQSAGLSDEKSDSLQALSLTQQIGWVSNLKYVADIKGRRKSRLADAEHGA